MQDMLFYTAIKTRIQALLKTFTYSETNMSKHLLIVLCIFSPLTLISKMNFKPDDINSKKHVWILDPGGMLILTNNQLIYLKKEYHTQQYHIIF